MSEQREIYILVLRQVQADLKEAKLHRSATNYDSRLNSQKIMDLERIKFAVEKYLEHFQ